MIVRKQGNAIHTWQQINWKPVLREVRQYQAAIVEAEHTGNPEQVRALQDRLVQSQAARWLAVRRVTSTTGKRSPGIDGQLWDTPERKFKAAQTLEPRQYQPKPARRVTIPKKERRLRPLGILTMRDRAMQALYTLALDPVAEARADPHSYGFRTYRSTADAIARCQEIFQADTRPWWILNADIERCFETISHAWLIEHLPLDSAMVKGWLRAGYVENGQLYPAERGLPQGGILSPKLANMALDGLEAALENLAQAQRRRQRPVYLVRYADDFLVMSDKKRWLQDKARPCISAFLQTRGMQLSAEKTTLVHLKHGVDFLGFRLCARKGTVCVEPTRQSVVQIVHKVEALVRSRPDASPEALIQCVNPVLRGWAEYYKHLENRQHFVEIDAQVNKLLWAWAMARHVGLFKRRHARRYFTSGPATSQVFQTPDGRSVYRVQTMPYYPYTPIEPTCNPYDTAWASYLQQRTHSSRSVKRSPHL